MKQIATKLDCLPEAGCPATHCSASSDTPETDAQHKYHWLDRGEVLVELVVSDFARKLERERNAAIKMAWELVQELAQKCDDPIHKKQRDQIRELHHAWTIPPNATAQATTPAPTNNDHGNKQ